MGCWMENVRASRYAVPLIVGTLTGLMLGCGAGGAAPGNATQVVAKVNGRELTVSQLNQELVAMNAPDSGAASTQEALKRLIDKELLVQAASQAKLDVDPIVQLHIDAALRETLAQAYEERQVYPSVPIDEAELHKFYDSNPDLFSARRVYHAVAFNTDGAELPDALLANLGQTHSADAVRAQLSRSGVKFQEDEVTRTAETLPLELVPRFAAAKAGDVVVATTESGSPQVLLLHSIDISPVSYDQAKNAIGHFLRGRRNEAALKAYLQQLQSAAKIRYVGESGSKASTGQ
jgi:EpsD family peptidyl-prolyl cis-trans isomerase